MAPQDAPTFRSEVERLYRAASDLGLHLCLEPPRDNGQVFAYLRWIEGDQFVELPTRIPAPGARA